MNLFPLLFLLFTCNLVWADPTDYTKAFGITRGQLEIYTPPKNDYRLYVVQGMRYLTRFQNTLDLRYGLNEINSLLRHEMSSRETCQQFLQDDLARLLTVSLVWPRTYIISKDLLSLAPFSDTEKTIISKYALSIKPHITGETWSLSYNVLTHDGAVENWTFTGPLCPLAITSFKRSEEEPLGSFSDQTITQFEAHYKEPNPARPPLLNKLPNFLSPTEIFAEKLTFIHINIVFRHGQIQDLLHIIEQKSKELDPDKKGIPFTLKIPLDSKTYHPTVEALDLRNISLAEILGIATGQTNLEYKIDDSGVHFMPSEP